jgi:hypothetical protein
VDAVARARHRRPLHAPRGAGEVDLHRRLHPRCRGGCTQRVRDRDGRIHVPSLCEPHASTLCWLGAGNKGVWKAASKAARLDLEVAAGWASPSSRGPVGRRRSAALHPRCAKRNPGRHHHRHRVGGWIHRGACVSAPCLPRRTARTASRSSLPCRPVRACFLFAPRCCCDRLHRPRTPRCRHRRRVASPGPWRLGWLVAPLAAVAWRCDRTLPRQQRHLRWLCDDSAMASTDLPPTPLEQRSASPAFLECGDAPRRAHTCPYLHRYPVTVPVMRTPGAGAFEQSKTRHPRTPRAPARHQQRLFRRTTRRRRS